MPIWCNNKLALVSHKGITWMWEKMIHLIWFQHGKNNSNHNLHKDLINNNSTKFQILHRIKISTVTCLKIIIIITIKEGTDRETIRLDHLIMIILINSIIPNINHHLILVKIIIIIKEKIINLLIKYTNHMETLIIYQ